MSEKVRNLLLWNATVKTDLDEEMHVKAEND